MMSRQSPTYEELKARLAEAESVIEAIRKEEIDAIVGEKRVYLVRLREMEEALRKSKNELELRVQERTAELEKLNEDLRREVERRKKFEAGLKNSTQKIIKESNRRKYISRRLVDMLERERLEIATVLHNEVGVLLVTIKMNLEMLESGSAKLDQEKLKAAKDMISKVINYSRNVMNQLRPTALDHLGLVPSIRGLIEEAQKRANLQIHFHHGDDINISDAEKNLAIYRIAQESLNNIIKYAEATHVFIYLTNRNSHVQLSIEDDGIGFDSNELTRNSENKSFGMDIMKERAAMIGGELKVETSPGKGTTIIVRMPV
jgi:signal transduction histidine kinase